MPRVGQDGTAAGKQGNGYEHAGKDFHRDLLSHPVGATGAVRQLHRKNLRLNGGAGFPYARRKLSASAHALDSGR
jgi:hypothetical protein